MFARNPFCTPGRPIHRTVACVTLLAFLVLVSGCASWRAMPMGDLDSSPQKWHGRKARFYFGDGRALTMVIRSVDFPFVYGTLTETVPDNEDEWSEMAGTGRPPMDDENQQDQVEVDCRDVRRLEIYDTSMTAPVLIVFGLVAIGLVAASSASSNDPPASSSSESSCPTLYLAGDGSRQLVGEPYAGAAVKSLQRRDMMPLPGPTGDRLELLMVNEAHETQATDFAQVLVVDHDPDLRAAATHEQDLVLVEDSVPPLAGRDGLGRDVTDRLAAADRSEWQSDLAQVLARDEPQLTEELVLDFAPPSPGTPAVLELDLGNTFWLDAVMHRFLALMGDTFTTGMTRAGHPALGPRIRTWLQREGVALEVSLRTVEGWTAIGHVHPVGPLALRHVAVPLPPDAVLPTEGPLQLRLRGGAGFWRVDRAALARLADPAPRAVAVAPQSVIENGKFDRSAALAAVDGRYQILTELGDSVRLVFTLPPGVPGRARSLLLHSDGYYQAHPPEGEGNRLVQFRSILDEPGGLSRYSLSLYAEFLEIARTAPRHTAAVAGGAP